MQKKNCPICNSEKIENYYSSTVPVLQNRVYKIQQDAIESNHGIITLTYCTNCQFNFNGTFDENIIEYDENYNNMVPSKVFKEYHKVIAKHLYNKYNLQGKTVYDIGCGKGTFLKTLCRLYPDVTGIGVDPSYEGSPRPEENVTFIPDFFKKEHITDEPALVLSRHVFEHIEYPVDFLSLIATSFEKYKDIPFFIEIPDYKWIVENKAFWDICYEHCNYFSESALNKLFDQNFSELKSINRSFGNQYLWAEGVLQPTHKENNRDNKPSPLQISRKDIDTFIKNIDQLVSKATVLIQELAANDSKIVIWGMATKGVIYSNIIDPKAELLNYNLDINTEKQNCYIPLSGHKILPPEILKNNADKSFIIIVMNTNYKDEINNQLNDFDINYKLYDANLQQL